MSDVVIWEAQPKQSAFISCPVDDVAFGGARGGGKSDAIVGDYISHEDIYGQDAIGMAFRRERTQLVELIERSKQIMQPLGYKWHEQDKYFRGPKGGRLRFAYLENDSDADGYQGHSYTRIYPEEMGTFPSESPINKLQATLRSGNGVPCQMKGTCNPGGAGHQWVKARYKLGEFPFGYEVFKTEFINPFTKNKIEKTRVFIPSKVLDNKFLGDDYVANLFQVGSEQLVKAWLDGDWSVIEGAFFDGWSIKNIIRPFEIPSDWLRFRSIDWGFAKPFSVGWWAVAGDQHEQIPRGAIIRYREWYGCTSPNVGLRLNAEEVADGILEREKGENITYGVLDPAAFATQSGPPISEQMIRKGVIVRPADNKRVARAGAMGGWDMMRNRIKGMDGVPMLYVFETCKDFIRTVPALQHDLLRAEDIDTEAEDHAADECFVADTLIRTSCGGAPISALRVGDLVQTRLGLRSVNAVFSHGTKPVFDLYLSNGNIVRGTANHPVWVEDIGFKELSSLSYGDMLRSWNTQTNTAELPEGFGESFMVKFPRAVLFITSMVMRKITILRIFNALHPKNIDNITRPYYLGCRYSVKNVIWYLRQSLRMQDFALINARHLGDDHQELITRRGYAKPVVQYSALTDILRSNSVHISAPSREATLGKSLLRLARTAIKSLRQKIIEHSGAPIYVVKVLPAGLQKVFNISVDEAEEYYANGVLVHNCRYACMSRPWVPEIEKPKPQRPTDYRVYKEESNADELSIIG